MNPALVPIPNSEVIAWALRESGHDPERVARRLTVKPDKVLQWLEGEKPPTLRQLKQLAAFLHRPLSLFFQPAPPRTVPLGAGYRRLRDVKPGAESPELRIAIRQMLARREVALHLKDEVARAGGWM